MNDQWWESPVCWLCDHGWTLFLAAGLALAGYLTRDFWFPALLSASGLCGNYATLHNTFLATSTDLMPSLYYRCGQAYADDGDWSNAAALYEQLLADYSDHSLAADIEAALAQSIVEWAKTAGAQELPAPTSTGSSEGELTEVIIQNDAPERMRIVFSGPEMRVEELEACGSCVRYYLSDPPFCPEQGPVGRYTLEPGRYDVVVEYISDLSVTPWIGNWSLLSGDEYYSCFYIVTTFEP